MTLLADGIASATYCPGATYDLKITIPEARHMFITTTLGRFSVNDGEECAGRRFRFDEASAADNWESGLTIPCTATGNVLIHVMSAPSSSKPYQENTVTFRPGTACNLCKTTPKSPAKSPSPSPVKKPASPARTYSSAQLAAARQAHTVSFTVVYGATRTAAAATVKRGACVRAKLAQPYGPTSVAGGACPSPTYPTKPFVAAVRAASPSAKACTTLAPYLLPSPVTPAVCTLSQNTLSKCKFTNKLSGVRWCLCTASKAAFEKGQYTIRSGKC